MSVNNVVSDKCWIDVALALLDWPFLFFVGISVFVWVFRANIVSLLGRGDIQISWGENRHIKLTEISEGVDEELDPLKEELQVLKEKVAKLESTIMKADNPQVKVVEVPDELSIEQKEIAKRTMISELLNGRYRWRSIEVLSKKAGIDEKETLNILRASVADIVLSTGKTGNQIARHITR